MKFLKLTAVGLKERAVYINPAHIVYVSPGFDGNTEVTTIASGDKARLSVAESAEQVLELIELMESGRGTVRVITQG
jgi:hypothetical protein